MAINVSSLEALSLETLEATWRDLVRQRSEAEAASRQSGQPDRLLDGGYYRLRLQEARVLLQLIGQHGWQGRPNAFSDVRVAVMDYFKQANQGELNGTEPREFLEFLLAFKKQHTALENDIDRLLLKVVDEYPNIGQYNFKDCLEWWLKFRRFAKGLRHRSEVVVHGKAVDGHTLADRMKDLYYDDLANLLCNLASGIERDGEKDQARGRHQLAAALHEAQQHLRQASQALYTAWQHCQPHVDMERKRGRLEHVFDEEDVKAARVGQFVHSYFLTMRMHGESDAGTHNLSLLEGTSYAKEVAKDRYYEAKICALIDTFEDFWGEDAAAFERELNALIGRDVWAFQHRASHESRNPDE